MTEKNQWIQTWNGGKLDFAQLDNLDAQTGVTPETIARSLAPLPRFAGQTMGPYSVGKHSLGVMACLSEMHQHEGIMIRHNRLCICGLLHDCNEGFMGGDMPSPFKRWLLDQWNIDMEHIEERVRDMIFDKLGVPVISHAEWAHVKRADMYMLKLERDLLMKQTDPWEGVDRIEVPSYIRWRPMIDPKWHLTTAMFEQKLTGLLRTESPLYAI